MRPFFPPPIWGRWPDAIGQIDSASCSGSACAAGNYYRTYAYDSYERPQSLTIQYGSQGNGGTPYTSSQTYNLVTGLLQNVIDFSGIQYTYRYNDWGWVEDIKDTNHLGTTYWTANQRDVYGRVSDETAANGVETVHTYDPVMGQLQQITAGVDNGVANISYGWDSVGNLTSRSDTVQGYSGVLLL